jgi:hypothetical protein
MQLEEVWLTVRGGNMKHEVSLVSFETNTDGSTYRALQFKEFTIRNISSLYTQKEVTPILF